MLLHLNGHLGNQLFQISAALESGAKKIKACLCRASSHRDIQALMPRLFDANGRDPASQSPSKIVLTLRCHPFQRLCDRLILGICSKLPRFGLFASRKFSCLSNFNVEGPLNAKTLFVSGYFQNRVPSEQSVEVIRSFIVQKEKGGSEIAIPKPQSPLVVCHTRRMDYGLKGFGILPLNYYQKALNEIRFELDGPAGLIIIGDTESKDLNDFIRREFEDFFTPVELTNSVSPDNCGASHLAPNDFLKIANADYLVTSNSTFPYWAALIGGVKRVFHPDPWYEDPELTQKAPHDWTAVHSGLQSPA